MSQSFSRKRAAPGAAPAGYSQAQQPTSLYQPTMNQLSDDQFLQWSQSAQPPNANITMNANANAYQEANTYATNTHNYPPNHQPPPNQPPTNQLSRRPVTQVVARPRYDSLPPQPWSENANGGAPSAHEAWGDNIQELEEKAQVAKRDAQAKRKQIPPFVQKLNSFLENGKNTELIRWSDQGNSFIVLDEDEFAKTLIPELFKHNNYASFVRQLNMYGFHKKVGLSDNSMRASERKNKTPSEYSNPYFRRGLPDLLWLIQKPKNPTATKKGRSKDADQNDDDVDDYLDDITQPSNPPRPRPQLMLGHGDSTLNQEQLQSVQRELAAIRNQQAQITHMMRGLKREHEQLYGQAATFQDQHNRHENSINAILTFLATVYNRSLQGHEGMQGIQNLFASAIPHDTSQGTVIDVADYPGIDNLNGTTPQPVKPFIKRQPLLLTDGQQQGRASTMSPSSTNSPIMPRQNRQSSQQVRTPQSGNVEELFDSAGNTPVSHRHASTPVQTPQTDIMSVIQNTNAQHASVSSNQQDFSNVLSSLENAGGQTPLTTSQRADMLRLMSNSTGPNGRSTNNSTDNALINSTPPSGPANFGRALASTGADLDQLARLQAEQDKSVQNLTNLLQPLSPTGSIPGLGDGTDVPPAPLDIDAFLSSNHDYFHEFPTDQPYDFGGDDDASNNLDFGNYQDNDELFGDLPPSSSSQPQPVQNGNDFGFDGAADGGGKIESLASSEATTPQSIIDEGQRVTRAKGRKLSSVDDDDDDESDTKRRRRL